MKHVTWKKCKKVLVLGFALITLPCIAIGCGKTKTNTEQKGGTSDTDLKPVTLKWYYPGVEKEGTKDVLEAFNKKLAEVLPNTTLEFVWTGENYDQYAEKLAMALNAKEKIDIAWEGWVTPLYQDSADGNLIGLRDLIEEYAPNLQREMKLWQTSWQSATFIDNEIYAVPCIQPTASNCYSLVYHETLMPYMDEKALLKVLRNNPSPKAVPEVFEIIDNAMQAAIDDGALKVGDLTWCMADGIWTQYTLMGYYPIYSNFYCDPLAKDITVLDAFTTPEMKMAVEYVAKWYDKGWITDTQALEQLDDNVTEMVQVNAFDSWCNVDENGCKTFVGNDGETYRAVLINTHADSFVTPVSYGAEHTYCVIPYTCQNPERAMMLLNLLHDDVGTVGNELYNMLCYGFEENSEEAKTYGWCNYTAVEKDGQMEADTTILNGGTSKHSMLNWAIGNTYYALHDGQTDKTTAKYKKFAETYWEDVYPKLIQHPLQEFVLDEGKLKEVMDAYDMGYKNARIENRSPVFWGTCGASGFESAWNKWLKDLDNAGGPKMKAAIQEHVDNYLNKK